jgi:protein-L-isoaspartate(D-aspartate) O-methyltransferase
VTRDYAVARRRMVREQLHAEGITDARVLAAMGEVPRHRFVPRVLEPRAYEACALPIGFGQTISQPFMVGLMTALLHLRGHERVLEIGTGSGYQAAVLSRLAHEVVTIERVAPLARRAAEILASLGCNNVRVLPADGAEGVPDHAPYDGIMVTACAPSLPESLPPQLADGGFLLVPMTTPDGEQVLFRYCRHGERLDVEESIPCRFVALRRGIEDDDDATA